jgi:hypothetical protein
MMAYNSYRPMVYNETRPDYDIMWHNGALMNYLSGDPHVLIPWPVARRVPQMVRQEWISSKEYLYVHTPWIKRRRQGMAYHYS